MSDVKMSETFQLENQEAIDEALFNNIVNPPEESSIADGLSALGSGIAWAGFWIALGLLLSVSAWKAAL